MQNKLLISIMLMPLTIFSCSKNIVSISSQEIKAKAVAGNIILTKSYEIPEGVFRGVLWPTKERPSFKIWLIKDDKELFFDISIPSEFSIYCEESTTHWKIKKNESLGNTIIYSAEKKNHNKSVNIELPVKKRSYKFSTLINNEGLEMITFMDISENVVDKGIFGYVIIE